MAPQLEAVFASLLKGESVEPFGEQMEELRGIPSNVRKPPNHCHLGGAEFLNHKVLSVL